MCQNVIHFALALFLSNMQKKINTTMNELMFNFFGEPRVPYYSKKEGDSYELVLHIPGFKKDEISIEVKNNRLTVEGKNDEDSYYKKSFVKSFMIPDEIDTDSIKAKQEDGVLKIVLPESKKSKKVIVID
jgi:HSP20 family protein